MTPATLEKLRALAEQMDREAATRHFPGVIDTNAARLRAILDGDGEGESERLRARVAQLEGSLAPFAQRSRWLLVERPMHDVRRAWYSRMPGHFPLDVKVTVADGRAAMSALGMAQPEPYHVRA